MKPFDSINKSFEDRFDPKMRTIGEAQLQNYDVQKEGIPPSKYFSIEFSKSIPEQIKNFLKDHRIFMMSCVAALALGGNWKINDKDSINTSFPKFLNILKNLGAKIN